MSVIAVAPSTAGHARQLVGRWRSGVEAWLEQQASVLALWTPICLGAGIIAWFLLPDRNWWAGWIAAMSGVAVAAWMLPHGGRLRVVIFTGCMLMAAGCALIWLRAVRVEHVVISRPVITSFAATATQVDEQPAQDRVRLWLTPDATDELPRLIRVNVATDDLPAPVAVGDRVRLRARLDQPMGPVVPGSYDFARAAWFQQLGGVGKALGRVQVIKSDQSSMGTLRQRLSQHIRARMSGSAGGIAAAFAAGDRGGIAKVDEDNMRAAGLTHLLSISGLHVTAVVAAAAFIALRLLALSRLIALRASVPVLSALAGACAGVGYTLLTGAEVPTVRSCGAAALVMIALSLGRQAMTLRLVMAGALFVLILWPESIIGASFQLSFAAITTIVALHESAVARRWFGPREEVRWRKLARGIASLLMTGIAVELVLASIAIFHFHRQGVYGALANIIAIPLTTFVTMPSEALALLFDMIGLGGLFWSLTDLSLRGLLWLAATVAHAPGAVLTIAELPTGAFAAMLFGGFWAILSVGRTRLLGVVPVIGGLVMAATAPSVDMIVSRDGKHMLLRDDLGTVGMLRPRAGDFIRDALGARAGDDDDIADIDVLDGVSCSTDLCKATVHRAGRPWRVAATRSAYAVDYRSLIAECRAADIMVSDRKLPDACRPKWLLIDPTLLKRTGGLAISLSRQRIETTVAEGDHHPWVTAGSAHRESRRDHYSNIPVAQ